MTFTEKRFKETLPNTGSPDNSKTHKKSMLSHTVDGDKFAYYSRLSRSNVGDATIEGATPEHELETTTNASIQGRSLGKSRYDKHVDHGNVNAESKAEVTYFETVTPMVKVGRP